MSDPYDDQRQPEEGECPTCQGRGCADCVDEDGGEDR